MKVQLFLQLSPEFGGTKFGPFQGVEIRLGSDPDKNDIVLPEALGVAPEHVKVIRQSDDAFIISPVERTAAVFIWRADGRPPKQVATPIAVGARDGFSVVTQEGPRFIILTEMEKPKEKAGAKDSFGKAKEGLTGGAFLQEFKRQGAAKFMTTTVGYYIRTARTFVTSGAIFSPRNLIMLGAIGSGWVLAGGVGCMAVGLSFSASKKGDELEDTELALRQCQQIQDEDPSVGSLTQVILADPYWKETLEGDDKLAQAYIESLKDVFARKARYEWVYKQKRSSFVDFQSAIENSKLPPGLKRVLPYSAAVENYVPDRVWSLLPQNSEGNRDCGRGPALITYRQGTNLGFSAVQVDTLVDSAIAMGTNIDEKRSALLTRLGRGPDDEPPEWKEDELQAAPVGSGGMFQCLYLDGDDDRDNVRVMARQLDRKLGASAPGLPDAGQSNWVASRLMKFYAADFLMGFDDIKFNKNDPPSASLSGGDAQQKFVIDQSASVMARAVAIPCMARLDKQFRGKDPPAQLGSAWPSLTQCGVLRILIDYGEI